MNAKRLALILGGLFIMAAALAPSAWAAPVTGAGFTTVNQTIDGTGHCKNGNPTVNCNIYDSKQYVWLNGGPNVAYVGDGDYFFAVLVPGGQNDPNDNGANNLSDMNCAPYTCPATNGDSTLIPIGDPYTNRKFHVTGGTITNVYGSTHQFANNKIRLMPYDDTTNPGGVYILAICSLANGYSVNANSCKYDAFKVQESECQGDGCNPPSTNSVLACKYYDSNADGSFQDGSESKLQGWPMTINPSDGVDYATQLTDSSGCVLWTGLADNLYTVTEGAPTETNWYNSQPGPNPTFLIAPTGPSQSVEVSGGLEQGRLEFGNFCTGVGGGFTKGYWSNTNGYTDLSNGLGGVIGALSFLRTDLNLRDSLGGTQPNGINFDPTCYCTQNNCPPNVTYDCPTGTSQALRTWLVNANAKSMAYMLSVQLAAMELNVRQGHVTGEPLVLAGLPPAGCTVPGLTPAGVISITNLMTAANNPSASGGSNHSLYQDPLTTANGIARSCQEYLKNALDNANNNLNFIQQSATTCTATFP